MTFEWLSVASAVLELILTGREGDLDDPGYTALWLVVTSLILALTFWISRGRSRTGRIIYTVLTALAVAVFVFAYWNGDFEANGEASGEVWLTALAGVETAILMALLWWPSTTAWLRGSR